MAAPPPANYSPLSPLSAALRPIRTTIPEAPSHSYQPVSTIQGAAGSAEEATVAGPKATLIHAPLNLRLSLPASRRNALGWLACTFGDAFVVRVVQGLFVSVRRVFFNDAMESIVFIVMTQQQDGVLLPRVGFTDCVLQSAYCSAIQWYLEIRGRHIELKELVSQDNDLPIDCFRFNIPSGGQVVRSINDDITSVTPVVVASGYPALRRVLQGIPLIIAFIFSLAVPYFVARYLVSALLREEYNWVVQVTVVHIRRYIDRVEPHLRFAYSVLRIASKFD